MVKDGTGGPAAARVKRTLVSSRAAALSALEAAAVTLDSGGQDDRRDAPGDGEQAGQPAGLGERLGEGLGDGLQAGATPSVRDGAQDSGRVGVQTIVPPTEVDLTAVDAFGTWVSPPGRPRVSLARRPILRAVLALLVRRHLADREVTTDEVIDAGWPGERMQRESALQRAYWAIWTLRALGLGQNLVTSERGYALQHVRIHRSEGTTQREQVVGPARPPRSIVLDTLVGSLAAGIAHNVSNPLTALIGNLSFALEDGEEMNPTTRSGLTDALGAAERIARVVNDLRVLFRVTRDGLAQVDLESSLQQAIERCGSWLRDRAIVTTSIDPVPQIEGSVLRLTQLFSSLLAHVARTLPARSREENEIKITLRHVLNDVEVEVSDNGLGLAPELLSRAFEPIFAAWSSDTVHAPDASGLGLVICQVLTTSMGGTLEVNSPRGRGTTYLVRWPASLDGTNPRAPRSVT